MIVIGIDISKDRLDIASSTGERFSANNEDHAIDALVGRFTERRPDRIVMEATGGYEIPLAGRLIGAGLPAAVVNPRQVHDFGKATGQLAKNDQLDARILVQYGQAIDVRLRTAADEQRRELGNWVKWRQSLVKQKAGALCRKRLADRIGDKQLADEIGEHVDFLAARIDRLDRKITRMIRADDTWKAEFDLLESIKGVGAVTAATLVALMPELGTINRRQAAALAGLAPFCRDSGTMRGKRAIWGGRAHVRHALYQAANTARMHNPVIEAYYNHLVKEKKKPTKVAMIACARKLLVIANTMMKNGSHWIDLS